MPDATTPAPAAQGKPPVAGAPPEGAKSPEPDARLAQVEKQLKAAAQEKLRLSKEREELKREREASAKDKAELTAWKAQQVDKKRNPLKYMEAEYGKDFYEKLTEMRLSGVPTPDLLASELEDTTSKLRKEFEEKTAALQKQLEERDAKAAESESSRQKSEYEAGVLSHLKANGEKYKLVTAMGEEKTVLRLIEDHFRATAKQDEDGAWTGELLTAEQACELMEKHLDELAEKFGKAKTPAPTAPTPPKSVAPGKRSESSQRTAQPNQTAPLTDAERLKRARAVYDAKRAGQ